MEKLLEFHEVFNLKKNSFKAVILEKEKLEKYEKLKEGLVSNKLNT